MNGKVDLCDPGEVLRDEMVQRDRIARVLADGPKTIPEIAHNLGQPTYEVTKWLMAMRRYGQVRDLSKDRADDYYRYELVEARR